MKLERMNIKKLSLLSFLVSLMVLISCHKNQAQPLNSPYNEDNIDEIEVSTDIHEDLRIQEFNLDYQGIQPYVTYFDHANGRIQAYFDESVDLSQLMVTVSLSNGVAAYSPQHNVVDFSRQVVYTVSHPEVGSANYLVYVAIKK